MNRICVNAQQILENVDIDDLVLYTANDQQIEENADILIVRPYLIFYDNEDGEKNFVHLIEKDHYDNYDKPFCATLKLVYTKKLLEKNYDFDKSLSSNIAVAAFDIIKEIYIFEEEQTFFNIEYLKNKIKETPLRFLPDEESEKQNKNDYALLIFLDENELSNIVTGNFILNDVNKKISLAELITINTIQDTVYEAYLKMKIDQMSRLALSYHKLVINKNDN